MWEKNFKNIFRNQMSFPTTIYFKPTVNKMFPDDAFTMVMFFDIIYTEADVGLLLLLTEV